MTFREAIEKYLEKRREEKEQFKAMEREVRLKRKLEQKMKTPAQKEYEFYMREEKKNNLDKFLKQKRKQREKKLKALSSPFNKHQLFNEKMDLIDGNFIKNKNSIIRNHNAFK